MTLSSKRAEYVALASLVLSIIFFGIAFFLGRWSEIFSVGAVSWLILSSALICLVLVIQFHQRALAEQEKLDMGQVAKDKESETIFQAKGERALMFAVAQRRLGVLEKWFIPIFSGVIAVYQIVLGLYLWRLRGIAASSEAVSRRPEVCAICMTAIAFVSFLISRYGTGMSSELRWKPLRAGSSSLLGVAVVCFSLGVGLALAYFQIFVVLRVIDYVVPILLLVLGIETALNAVLDIYRPRITGQYSRAAFDSRLLGTLSEPGGILRTAAGAIDYQFGFKVSQTWFYRLLEKAIMPLVLFASATLYLLSCVVVIAPNEQAIIEHFGNPVDDANNVRIVGPGLCFKWPWPIDNIYKYPTKKVSELSIGFVPKAQEQRGKGRYGPLLWGEAHYEKEYHLLVASEQSGASSEEGAVPFSLVMAAVPVQYKIKDLYSYVYNHNEPKMLLESICYRELTRFAASAQIEVDSEAGLEHSLLGAGRDEAKEVLTKRIQKAADNEGLGVEIVFVGLQGIHPPPKVAADYQEVIGAVQQRQALILGAQAERNKVLSTLVGSVRDANDLYVLAKAFERARENNEVEKIGSLGKELDSAFSQMKGDIFMTLREAQSGAFEKATLARATGERFTSRLKAYRAAEDIYRLEQRLSVFEESLGDVRKYVIVSDPNDTEIFIFDLKDKLPSDLLEMGGIEESR